MGSSPPPKNQDEDYSFQPQDQALNQSLQVEYQSNEGADSYGMETYQSSTETTAQTLDVASSQVASHALATNFPTTSSETLFHEILQQQGVDMDEDEEDAF